MEDDMDAYQVLGVPDGSSDAEIKKAYRALALQKHPDKNRGNPHAAKEFSQLQDAYNLLCDAKARAALDNLHRARQAHQARQAGQSAKRQQMRHDLEQREQAWSSTRSEEAAARTSLKVEIARLRREAAERLTCQQQVAAAKASEPETAGSTLPADHLRRTLKVSWDRKVSDYTVKDLEDALSVHGKVEDVVLRQGKRKCKGSAWVTMAELAGATAAPFAVNGNLSNPLLVLPVKESTSQIPQQAPLFMTQSLGTPAAGTQPARPASQPGEHAQPGLGTPSEDFESITLAKLMRRAAEQKNAQQNGDGLSSAL